MYEELTRAIPIILGGLIALLGGIGTQAAVHFFAWRREQKTMRRERLETIVKALYRHSEWLEDKFNTLVFRAHDHDIPSPLNEAKMLQELYFPELDNEILELMQAEGPMVEFMHKQRLERVKDEAAWSNNWDPTPYNNAQRVYYRALYATTRKCRDILQSQLKS